jgi:hypothetical protein
MGDSFSTYSFQDLTGAIVHPLVGSYAFAGQEGAGSVSVAMATEKTAHDVAADGTVMVSKIPGHNGTITIEAQQTSKLHKWLLSAYNLLWNADTAQWAAMGITMRNISDGTSHIANGVSFQKIPDKAYQAQGQRVTWVLMAADIQSINA